MPRKNARHYEIKRPEVSTRPGSRSLHLVGHQARSVTFWVGSLQELGIPEDRLMPVGPFKDGEIISRLPPFDNCSELTEKLNFAYGVAFDPKGPAARGVPVDLALDQWRRTLRNQVIPKFQKFFRSKRRKPLSRGHA